MLFACSCTAEMQRVQKYTLVYGAEAVQSITHFARHDPGHGRERHKGVTSCGVVVQPEEQLKGRTVVGVVPLPKSSFLLGAPKADCSQAALMLMLLLLCVHTAMSA